MRPLATCDLMEKIIHHTDTGSDREYIHIYVDCNTNISDRTAANYFCAAGHSGSKCGSYRWLACAAVRYVCGKPK